MLLNKNRVRIYKILTLFSSASELASPSTLQIMSQSYSFLRNMQIIFDLYVRVELIIIYLIAFQRGESVIGTVDEPSSEDVKREGLAGME